MDVMNKKYSSATVLAGYLIDGSGSDAKKNICIKIENEKFSKIRDIESRDYKNQNLIDLTDYTIFPALIDCHVHLFMSGTDNQEIRKQQLTANFSHIKNVIKKHIKQHMQNGVIAIRDGGDHLGHALLYKQTISHKIKLNVSGWGLHKKGRYGQLIGISLSKKESLKNTINKITNNIDQIKIVNSGLNSLLKFGKETPYQFDAAEMRNAVIAAKSKKYPVMVHANGKEPVRISIKSGIDSIEHGFFMGKDNLQKMAENKVTWVPTAYTMKAISQYFPYSSTKSQTARKNLNHQIKQLALARDTGVNVAVGTDAGSIGVHHGSSVAEEFKLFKSAGYKTEEIIKCGTYNGAKLLGLEDKGLIKKDFSASFIAVKGDICLFPENMRNSIFFHNDHFLSKTDADS